MLTVSSTGPSNRHPRRHLRPANPHIARLPLTHLRAHDDIYFIPVLSILPLAIRRQRCGMQFFVFSKYVTIIIVIHPPIPCLASSTLLLHHGWVCESMCIAPMANPSTTQQSQQSLRFFRHTAPSHSALSYLGPRSAASSCPSW
jgi:hypothetical protein